MARELQVRVPALIASWVRQQPGSASETVLALAKAAWQRRQTISLHDPGPGDDRLKVRLPSRVIRFVRLATHSRDMTAAIRKLLRWGAEGQTLPASPVPRLSPSGSPLPAPASRPVEICLEPEPSRFLLPRVSGDSWAARAIAQRYEENPDLAERNRAVALAQSEGVVVHGNLIPAYPSRGMGLARWESMSPVVLDSAHEIVRVPAGKHSLETDGVPTRGEAFRKFVTDPNLLVPLGFLGVWVISWAWGRWGPGAVVAAKAVAGTVGVAKAAPAAAAWTPKAAAGLGAMFL